MKYPKQQFNILLQSLTTLNEYIDIYQINHSHLHFLVYQQFDQGQSHNKIVIQNNKLCRLHKINDLLPYEPIININYEFKLYPLDLVDANIETAIRKALKLIKTQIK